MNSKKILSLLLVAVMVFALAACGSSNTGSGSSAPASSGSSAPASSGSASSGSASSGTAPSGSGEPAPATETVTFEKKKVAFLTNSTDDVFLTLKDAYENVIGPALNIEFMFSEGISDAGAMTTFIESAYSSGCEGIISTLSNSIDQGAAVANDLGMYFIGIASAPAKENTTIDSYLSVAGASAAGFGSSYHDAIAAAVSDGGDHSIVILSGAAAYGATSFIEGTAGSLKALQDLYGLTFDEDPYALATSATTVEATNNKGLKVMIVPGMGEQLINAVTPLIQSGEYDVVVGTTDIYSSLSVAVDEVEKSTGKNIKFISRCSFSDAMATAMNAKDSTGNPVVDAMITEGTYGRVAAAIMMRNAFDGYADQMRDNGAASFVGSNAPLVVTSGEQYNALTAGDMPYSFVTVDEILALCCKVNPDVTWKTIDDFGSTLTTDAILAKFN